MTSHITSRLEYLNYLIPTVSFTLNVDKKSSLSEGVLKRLSVAYFLSRLVNRYAKTRKIIFNHSNVIRGEYQNKMQASHVFFSFISFGGEYKFQRIKIETLLQVLHAF